MVEPGELALGPGGMGPPTGWGLVPKAARTQQAMTSERVNVQEHGEEGKRKKGRKEVKDESTRWHL